MENVPVNPIANRRRQPEEELYTWKAPTRLFKKRNREFYSTVAAFVLLLSVVLLFAKEFLLIGVIMAFGFVVYVLSSVEPEDTEHRLTTYGVRMGDKLYYWDDLARFWWEGKWKEQVLTIEHPSEYPGKIILLLGKGKKETIDKILNEYLVEEKPEDTFVDKASQWLQDKVPLEAE